MQSLVWIPAPAPELPLPWKNSDIAPGSVKVVVHDREPATLEFIAKGYIDATLINKTATDEYLAILIMEDWNNGGLKNIPVSSTTKPLALILFLKTCIILLQSSMLTMLIFLCRELCRPSIQVFTTTKSMYRSKQKVERHVIHTPFDFLSTILQY